MSVPDNSKLTTDDFDFGRVLGEGAYGAVIFGTEKKTKQEMAVKIISKKHILKENKKQYAITEKDILTACDSPFVIKLYNTFQDQTNLYYCMELAPNGELFDLIRKLGNFSLETAAFYSAEIVLALDYLHNVKGVVHRDLKPENILLSATKHIKITDFGTAKVIGLEKNARSNSFVGTPEYIAPELLSTDDKYACKSSDLWSLGCIIYQMLCGRSPFRGVTEYLTFQKVTAGKVVYPNNIPPIAKDIIDKLLVADPQNRLGSQNMSDLKSHPFFKGVSWDNILSLVPPQIKNPDPLLWEEDIIREEEERKKLVKERLRKEWSQFLLENEEIVQSGLIYKRRKLSIKKRFLILTSTPRLIYIDPKKKILKGEVPWSKKLVVEIKDDVDWRINTPKRIYYMEDLQKNSQRWGDCIKEMQDLAK